MPSSGPGTGPRPGAPSVSRSTVASSSSSGASSRSSAPTSPSRRWPSCPTAASEPYRLVVVGGPSGPHGEKALQGLFDLADARGVREQVHFIDPQPHELLSSYYRAADVCLVPSRSESFGLVALEAAACGTPVVASAVGGLTTLVDHGHTGFLVDEPDPVGLRRRRAPGLRRAAGRRAPVHRLGVAGPPLHVAGRRPDAGRAARRAGRRAPRRVQLSATPPRRATA